jgi:hypothetical protein
MLILGHTTAGNVLAMANAQYLKAEKNARPSITCWKPQHRRAGDDFCQVIYLILFILQIHKFMVVVNIVIFVNVVFMF